MVFWNFVTFLALLIFLSSQYRCYRVLDKFQVAKYSNLQPFRIIQPIKWKGCTHQCKLRSNCGFVIYKRKYHACYLMDRSHVYDEIGTSYLIGKKEDWNMHYYGIWCDTCSNAQVCDRRDLTKKNCRILECGIPPTIDNANILGNLFSVGSNICYQCRDGYKATTTGTVCSKCKGDGQWSDVTLACESEWELAFRAEAGNGRHVFVAWLDNTFTSPSDSGCQLLTKTNCPDHYRHPMLDQSTVDEFLASKEKIKLALYSDGKEVAYLTFTTNGYVTTRTNWFSYYHVISSSWTDIGKNPADYQMFSVYDGYNMDRTFYICAPWGGCNEDMTWLIVKEPGDYADCQYDQPPSKPAFLYSPYQTKANFEVNGYGLAEVMAIFVSKFA